MTTTTEGVDPPNKRIFSNAFQKQNCFVETGQYYDNDSVDIHLHYNHKEIWMGKLDFVIHQGIPLLFLWKHILTSE